MKKLLLASLLLILVPAFLLAADPLKTLKTDANGDFKLDKTAHVGSLILDPGTYRVHSVMKNGKHAVHFVEETTHFEAYPQAMWQPYSQHLAAIGCTTEKGDKATETALFYRDEGDHIVVSRVTIKGEDHAHVF